MNIPSDITTFNGATVAKLILDKSDQNVDYLIDVLSTKNSNSLESPLLEFKGTWRKPADDASPDDQHKWNVVKALVAMYNAYGGCVLVGLAEGHPDKTQLKLLNCDPDGILDNPKNEWKDLQSHFFRELFKGERGQGLFNIGADESYQVQSGSLNLLEHHITAYHCYSRRYGGNAIALIVSPLDSKMEAIYISHKAKRKNGPELKEKLLYHRDHLLAESPSIPKSGDPEDPNAWTRYFEERQTAVSITHFKSLLENAPEYPVDSSRMEVNDDELLSALQDQMLREKIFKLLKQLPVTGNNKANAGNNRTATTNRPLHTIDALTSDISRSQKLAQLNGKTFDAICIKSCGNLGFLAHRDFENGIFIHTSVTGNTPLVESQRWRVTVGVRFNEKKSSWCYSALSATLLSQKASVAHQYKDISSPEARAATIQDLQGTFYEANCTFGRGTCGYLAHPEFEGQIYIDIPVTGGVEIRTGQKWRFEVGAHCLPPEGLWIYRARNASLISDAAEVKYPLSALNEESSRERIKKSLENLIFEATCTIGKGNCGGLSHADFEGQIYIDLPVTNNVQIKKGQLWRFKIGAHRMGPNGPWVYRARKATLIIPNEATPEESDQQEPLIPYEENALKDPVQRKHIDSQLKEKRFTGTVIRSFPNFMFLSCPSFSSGVFCHRSTITGVVDPEVGQTWEFEVQSLFNNKRQCWCYATTTAKFVSTPTQPSVNPAISKPAHQKPINPVAMEPTPPCGDVCIYIDETWPGTQDPRYKNIGVIGGIVTSGVAFKQKILPVIGTHMDIGPAEKALHEILRHPDVYPFVLPIAFPKGENACSHYLELTEQAILMLLGWMIPARKEKTSVNVYLEHIAGFTDGTNGTSLFKTLSSALDLLSGTKRFSNWSIKYVSWQGKNFEYIPYGDLVCKTCVPLREHKELAEKVSVRNWPGFLPFSPSVFPLLRDMDTASPAGCADLLIAFAQLARGTPLFRQIVNQTIERAKEDVSFRDKLLHRFEECYEQKDRNTSMLNQLTRPFLSAFPPDAFAHNPRSRFVRMMLELQRANHNGDPEIANSTVANFLTERERLMQIDRELCAEVDLNRCVHHHDLFEFDKALNISMDWIKNSLFPALTLATRGKLFSSRGQSYALLGRSAEANHEFLQALELFNKEKDYYRREIDQTSVYQAMNLLDLDPASAIRITEGVLRHPLSETAKDPYGTLQNPYHEHLFLKALWTLRATEQHTISDYLDSEPNWSLLQDYHPYELIQFYRCLLVGTRNLERAQAEAKKLEDLFKLMDYGGVIGLIHSYIRVVFKHMQIRVASDAEFIDELNIVERSLPAAKSQIDLLRQAWTDETINVSFVLPFNYK